MTYDLFKFYYIGIPVTTIHAKLGVSFARVCSLNHRNGKVKKGI